MSDLDDVLSAFDTADKPADRGPWCADCGHEYRTKRGTPAPITDTCPYCGVMWGVVNEKPFHENSKSSIELWERCNRRWYYKYIAHFPEPKNRYAAWGIEGHEVAENYLTTGQFPQVNDMDPKSMQSQIARSLLGGIPHTPRPDHPGLKVETEFHFEFEGVRYGGFKDYEAPVTWPLLVSCEPLVGDHKFTGNLQYALSEYELAHDKQGIIYAWDVLRRAHPMDPTARVWLNWVYMKRGDPTARPVRVVIGYADAFQGMQKLNVVGRHLTLLKARKDLDARAFPPNSQACYDFKEPCPHMDACATCGDMNFSNQVTNRFT